MQSRTVAVNLDNPFSSDAPLTNGNFLVRISGADVSNDALLAAKNRANIATCVPIDLLFTALDCDFVEAYQAKAIRDAGIELVEVPDDDKSRPWFCVLDENENGNTEDDPRCYDAVALVLSYLGYGIEDFSYVIVPEEKPEVIVGEGSSILDHYGYGITSHRIYG